MRPLLKSEIKQLRQATEMQRMATPELTIKLPIGARRFYQHRNLTVAAAKILLNEYLRYNPGSITRKAADRKRKFARFGRRPIV